MLHFWNRNKTARVVRWALMFCGLLCAVGAQAQYQKAHPRLYMNSGQLAQVRARVTGPNASLYSVLVNYERSLAASNPNLVVTNSFDGLLAAGRDLSALAYLSIISADPYYAGRADLLGHNLLAVLQPTKNAHWWQYEEVTSVAIVAGFAVWYDWRYAQMSAADKSGVAAILLSPNLYSARSLFYGGYWDYNDHRAQNRAILLQIGIAFEGDGYNDATARRYVRETMDWFRRQWLPALDQAGSDGSWHEGMSYFNTVIVATLDLAALWRAWSGEDLLPLSNHLRRASRFYLYSLRPGLFFSAEGDAWRRQPDFYDRLALLALATEFRDEQAQWLAGEIYRRGLTGYPPPAYDFHPSLWADLTVPETSPQTANWPLTAYFPAAGKLVLRTGWSLDAANHNDLYIAFQTSRFVHVHTQPAVAGFEACRGTNLLAVDTGQYSYGTAHYYNFYTRTIAHNALTVYDPNESFDLPGLTGLSRDGGQRNLTQNYYDPGAGWFVWPTDYPDGGRAQYKLGKLLWQSALTRGGLGGLSFAIDATPAYAAYKVSRVLRKVCYLPESPNAIPSNSALVIFDQVDSASPAYTKKWLLHTKNALQIDGTTLAPTGINEYAAATARADSGTDKADITCLLPGASVFRVVGGPGYEYWVDDDGLGAGRNYPLDSATNGTPQEQANWRLEIRPTNNANSAEFLNVISLMQKGFPAPACTLVNTTEGTAVGVGRLRTVALFGRSRTISGPVTFSYADSGTVTVIATDLIPNHAYQVTTSAVGGGVLNQRSLSTNAQGVLEFTESWPASPTTQQIALTP